MRDWMVFTRERSSCWKHIYGDTTETSDYEVPSERIDRGQMEMKQAAVDLLQSGHKTTPRSEDA
jgi:hypothetical protein